MRKVSGVFLPLALAGLAAAQVNPTGIVSVLPANGATGVPLNAQVIIALAYPASYLTNTPVHVTTSGKPVAGTITYPDFGNASSLTGPPGAFGWYIFKPSQPWGPQTAYTVEVDFPPVSGIPNRPPYLFTFTTGTAPDNAPLQLISTTPSAGQTGVNARTPLTLRFNKPLQPYSFKQGWFDVRDISTGYIPYSYSALQIQPDGATIVWDYAAGINGISLPLGDAFQLEFPGPLPMDWAGNTLAVPPNTVFTTSPNPGREGPILTGSAPVNGASGVPTNSRMVLVFDKPLAKGAIVSGVSLDAGGPVAFTLDNTTVPRALIVKPNNPLPQKTQVNLTVTGLLDQLGAPLSAPITLSFQTGTAPETRALQMTSQPTGFIPQNGFIRSTFNRSIDPAILSIGGVLLGPPSSNTTFPVPYSLSPDGLSLTISPAGLPAGAYQGRISLPIDRFLGTPVYQTTGFTITADTDTTRPRILAVNPPGGAIEVPASSQVQVLFSKAVVMQPDAPGLQLTENGNAVAGSYVAGSSSSGTLVTFTPKLPLSAGDTFQIHASGFIDLEGNTLPDFSSSFTAAAAPKVLPAFQVVTVSPAANAVNVDPSTQVGLTFNRAVDPVSLAAGNFLFCSSVSSYVPGSWRIDGASATFTPDMPLPNGTCTARVVASDIGGASVLFTSSFRTSAPAQPSGTAPSVVSASPADGGAVTSQSAWVVLTFSEAVQPATVNKANFHAYGRAGDLNITLSTFAPNQVGLQFSTTPGDIVTIYVNPAVRDFQGNTMTGAFRSTVIASSAAALPATFVGTRPDRYSLDRVPPGSPITLYFSAPLDRPSVEKGLLVAANGALVSGTVSWSDDSQSLSFIPSAPFPYSATLAVAIGYPAHDLAGNLISFSLSNFGTTPHIADPPPSATPLRVIQTTPYFPNALPIDAALDLQFSGPVPAAFAGAGTGIIFPVNPLGGAINGPAIACSATQTSPQTVRFQPATQLGSGVYYSFQFDSGTGVTAKITFHTGSMTTPANPSLTGFGPSGPGVPMNARLSVTFSGPISELSSPSGLVLQGPGGTVPISLKWNSSDRAVIATPFGLLQPDSDYSVLATGFADYAGHVIPDQTWTFHTSRVIDLTPPAILRIEPSGSGASPNTPVSVTFSKPVAADWIDQLQLSNYGTPGNTGSGSRIASVIGFSPDLTTAYLRPTQPLPAGHTIQVSVPQTDDLEGNQLSNAYGTSSTFTVAFTSPGAPTLIASTPDDGSTGLPVNAQIQVQFDQPIVSASLAGTSLFDSDGNPVAATARIGPDGRTVSIIPALLPSPGAKWTLQVYGVTNPQGAQMQSSFQSTFTFGSTLDTVGATFTTSPGSGQQEVPLGAVVRIRSSKPLNKLSVNSKTVPLTRLNRAVDSTLSVQDGGQTILLTPALPLDPDAPYQIFMNGVTDLAGNVSGTSVGFTTSDGSPPVALSLVAFDPQNGALNVSSSPLIRAYFNQPVDLAAGNGSLTVTGPAGAVAGTVFSSNQLVTFTPAANLPDGVYMAQLNGIADVNGNPFSPFSWTFTISTATVDTSIAKLLSTSPASGSVGVSISSPVVMNFSKPMSPVSAALYFGQRAANIPGSVVTQGSTVTFTPDPALPAAYQAFFNGQIADVNGITGSYNFGFTTGASPDTQPPTLISSYPTEGSTVPAYSQVVLRFSKPVVAPAASIQIYAGATLSSNASCLMGEDGQTIVCSAALPVDTQCTVFLNKVTDLAGNMLRPVSLHFTTGSQAQYTGPTVLSVSPPAGAMNVDPKTPAEVRFSNPMDAPTVQAAFSATVSGVLTVTTMTQDATGQIFDFAPAMPWPAGSLVNGFVSTAARDLTGVVTLPYFWDFTALTSSTNSVRAIAFSASARAVDVRFAGPVPATINRAYLRQGNTLVPSRLEFVEPDRVRFVPDSQLTPGISYGLVVGPDQEIALQTDAVAETKAEIRSLTLEKDGFHVRFSAPVNSMTLRKAAQMTAPDGSEIRFHALISTDGKEALFVPVRFDRRIVLKLTPSPGEMK